MTIVDDDDYRQKTNEVIDTFVAAFSQNGTDCDRIASELTRHIAENKSVIAALNAYGEAHPELAVRVGRAFEDRIVAAVVPVIEHCGRHEGLNTALERLGEVE